MLRIHVSAPVHPSEDEAKVRKAVKNLFPDAALELREGVLAGLGDGLGTMRTLIRRQKIMDAARRSLLRSLHEDGTRARFELSKQAAYSGRLSFAIPGAPLGDLAVDVQGSDLHGLFREMAPMTVRGIPVSEEEAERRLEKRRRARAAQEVADGGAEEWEEEVD